MSDLERSRIRKEAADAVTARAPRDTDQAVDTALRRYLGIAMFDALRRRRDDRRDERRTPSASSSPQPSARGAATTRKQERRS
jgi:hypothetical protein